MTRIRTLLTTPGLTAALLACVMAVSLLFPGVAMADDAIWAWVSVEVYDLDPGKTPTLVIVAQLAQDVELPAQTSLAIPKDSTLSWAGEIYGGDPANDPALEVTIEELAEYNLVHFTLKDSPRVQLELTVPESSLGGSPNAVSIDLEWTTADASERARIGVGVPFSSHLEDTADDTAVQVRSSDILYSLETVPVGAGDTIRFVGTMVAGTAPELTEAMKGTASEDSTDSASVNASGTVDDTATAEPSADETSEPLVSAENTASDEGGLNTTLLLLGGLVLAFSVVVAILIRRIRAERAA